MDRAAFTRALLTRLEEVLDSCARGGFREIIPRFEARFAMRGRRVTLHGVDGDAHTGRVLGIDPDGALRLEVDGRSQRFLAGDVTFAGERA